MSDWLIHDNAFVDCEVGTFTGGGRRNRMVNNSYVGCGTVHYLNNQGAVEMARWHGA
jgi:nitrous oxidase accessory protein NosD